MWKIFTVGNEDKKLAICNTFKAKVNHGGTTAKTFKTTHLIRHNKHHNPPELTNFVKAIKLYQSLESALNQ